MKKKKSFFPFLCSSLLCFLCSFFFQLNAFDSIKNIFKQSIETVKKGYNRLTGNNEKSAQIYTKKPILEKKNSEENKNIIEIATTTKTENVVNNVESPDTSDILNHNMTLMKDSLASKITKSKISNNVAAENIPYQEKDYPEKLNQYLQLIQYNNSLNDSMIEKIKKTALTKLEENPSYIKTIEKNIKKEITKATEKKLKRNAPHYKKNRFDSTEQKNPNIVTQNKEENQETQKNSQEIKLQTEIKEIEKTEKAQIEKLLLYDKKNKVQSPNPPLKKSEQKYKEKYFHLIQMILQRHKNDIDAVNKKFINNNTTNKKGNKI